MERRRDQEMRQASFPWFELAKQLLAHEAGNGRSIETLADAADSVAQKLSDQLSVLLGQEGVNALLVRSLHLAKVDPSSAKDFLQEVQAEITSAGFFSSLKEKVQGRDPTVVETALTAIFGNFLWLLSVFVGASLTFRLLRRIWSGVPLSEEISTSEEAEK